MSKLYWIEEIKEVFDNKINKLTMSLVEDTTIKPEQTPLMIQQIRLFRNFANEIIEEMEQAEREEEERRQEASAKEESSDGEADHV